MPITSVCTPPRLNPDSAPRTSAGTHLRPSPHFLHQGWRRLNKKALVDTISKKRTRKNTKVARAIVGASLDEVRTLVLSLAAPFAHAACQ